MTSELAHVFERSGVAALSDIESPYYQTIFTHLEKEQRTFLATESEFRSDDYKWPCDALHTWSRIWEYPYVYYHLQRRMVNGGSQGLTEVVDLGSGVTFLPFSVAKLGCHVHCLDVDAVCERDIQRAAMTVPHEPGTVEFRLISDGRLPLTDEVADVVYCVSVLEHIPRFEDAIEEIVRILKVGGLFVLTIDLDLCGYKQIEVERYGDMRRCLASYFDVVAPETTIHPLDIFHQWNSPIQPRTPVALRRLKFYFKQSLNALLGKGFLPTVPNLAVFGAVLKKREQAMMR